MILRSESIVRTSLKRRKMRKARSTESGSGMTAPLVLNLSFKSSASSTIEKNTTKASNKFIESLRNRRQPRATILRTNSATKTKVRMMLNIVRNQKYGSGRYSHLGIVWISMATRFAGCGATLRHMSSVFNRIQPWMK